MHISLPPLPRLPQVGLIACNDYILIECCIYRIIKYNFSGHPAYLQLIELFHDVRASLRGVVSLGWGGGGFCV